MLLKTIITLFLPLSLFAQPDDVAQKIVDKAMKVHGSALLANAEVDFDFRDRHYRAVRKGGMFTYERIFTDKDGHKVRDILSNSGLKREVDGIEAALAQKDRDAYANSVNAVLYFALLPFSLNDAAVIKTYQGETTIKGEPYHKVKVTFRQEGGGKDYEDEYVYWVHKKRLTMDYLAYNFHVDGGGARFRQAVNVRTIQGIRFQDYINYQPTDGTMDVAILDQLFEKGQLKELSRIETANVVVRLTK